ncbi:hypothetical protein SAMN04487770_12048 [Butyrivibrio sp. ob235]|uniref:hypothetical protein n=1 Tax=Butyrivibrio sp. ob235 TaxID=1761780 RepID=UPI0008B228D8|nr:hypothetical protein [Butyrivibrio sp. ob235]SEL90176.1 hypothetical protein SAMN04487770_12048 [Butyrivibrio sp. ob235]
MSDNYELTEEQKKELKQAIDDQMNRMGEVFSQCWESEEFKQAFIKDPKAIFREYEVNHNPEKEYVVIDSPEKTIVHVLPHDGIKSAVKGFGDLLYKKVEDLDDKDGRQILLDGWKYEIYQNTPDKFYIVIPHSPENLSPEELEMVNGGCFFAVLIFVAEVVALATTVAAAAEVAAVALVAAAIVEAAAAMTTAVAVAEGWMVVLTVTVIATANEAISGYFITTNAEAINHAANVVTR